MKGVTQPARTAHQRRPGPNHQESALDGGSPSLGPLAWTCARTRERQASRPALDHRRAEDLQDPAPGRTRRGPGARRSARDRRARRHRRRMVDREWTSSPLWARPRESTNLHNLERTRAFAERSASCRSARSARRSSSRVATPAGRNVGTVASLRAMFADARRPQAGMLVEHNPFAGLGLHRSKGRKEIQPPDQAKVARMTRGRRQAHPSELRRLPADRGWSAARPGELDALRWDRPRLHEGDDHDRAPVDRQSAEADAPKHGSRRMIAMTEPVHDRLPSSRTSPTRSSRRSASTTTPPRPATTTGTGPRRRRARNMSLYIATRHFYGWYALNVLELPPHVIALQLGHTTAAGWSANSTGTRRRVARERTRQAFRSTAPVVALRSA